MRAVIAASVAAAVFLAACSREEPARNEADMTATSAFGQGQAIAETLCAECHAVGMEGDSPHPDAVRLRELAQYYPVRALEEPLAEGIIVGHPDMPVFQFEPDHIDALLTYLEAIQVPQET